MGGIKQFTIGTTKKKKSRKATKPRVKNQDRWFLKSLDDVLGYSRPWKAVQKFYPSMLGNPCDRYLYYAYHGGLANQEVNPKLQDIRYGVIVRTANGKIPKESWFIFSS